MPWLDFVTDFDGVRSVWFAATFKFCLLVVSIPKSRVIFCNSNYDASTMFSCEKQALK